MKFCQFLHFTNKPSNSKKELFLPTPKPSTKFPTILSYNDSELLGMSSNPSLGYFRALIQKTKTLRKKNEIIQTNEHTHKHSIHFFNPPSTLEYLWRVSPPQP